MKGGMTIPNLRSLDPGIYVPFVGSRRSSGNLAGVGLGIPGH